MGDVAVDIRCFDRRSVSPSQPLPESNAWAWKADTCQIHHRARVHHHIQCLNHRRVQIFHHVVDIAPRGLRHAVVILEKFTVDFYFNPFHVQNMSAKKGVLVVKVHLLVPLPPGRVQVEKALAHLAQHALGRGAERKGLVVGRLGCHRQLQRQEQVEIGGHAGAAQVAVQGSQGHGAGIRWQDRSGAEDEDGEGRFHGAVFLLWSGGV